MYEAYPAPFRMHQEHVPTIKRKPTLAKNAKQAILEQNSKKEMGVASTRSRMNQLETNETDQHKTGMGNRSSIVSAASAISALVPWNGDETETFSFPGSSFFSSEMVDDAAAHANPTGDETTNDTSFASEDYLPQQQQQQLPHQQPPPPQQQKVRGIIANTSFNQSFGTSYPRQPTIVTPPSDTPEYDARMENPYQSPGIAPPHINQSAPQYNGHLSPPPQQSPPPPFYQSQPTRPNPPLQPNRPTNAIQTTRPRPFYSPPLPQHSEFYTPYPQDSVQQQLQNIQNELASLRASDDRSVYALEELVFCIGIGVGIILFLDKVAK